MLLEALFCADINPINLKIPETEAYREANASIDEATSYFKQILEDEDYKRLLKMIDDMTFIDTEEKTEQFKYGFVTGMRLMQEIYEYPVIR